MAAVESLSFITKSKTDSRDYKPQIFSRFEAPTTAAVYSSGFGAPVYTPAPAGFVLQNPDAGETVKEMDASGG